MTTRRFINAMWQDVDNSSRLKKRQRTQESSNEATSKSCYLWSDKELQDAVLRCQNSTHDDELSDKNRLRNLMECLLHSPGIFHNRPTRNCDTAEEGPLLPQIISQCIKHTDILNAEKSDKVKRGGSSTDWLQSALCDISCTRRSNGIRFHAYEKMYAQTTLQNKNVEHSFQLFNPDDMRQVDAWTYLANPKTITKSVYAAQFYEQFLKLAHDSREERNISEPPSMHLPPNAIIFLQKMQDLCKSQFDIAEVYLLSMIEPIKRKHLPRSDWIEEVVSEKEMDIEQFISNPIEKQSFVHMANSITDVISEKNVYKFPPMLVTIVAKVYFPFAKSLIEKLLSCAVMCHEDIPNFITEQVLIRNADKNKVQKDEHRCTSRDCSSAKQSFDCCVDMLSHLVATSDALRSLCYHSCDKLKTPLRNGRGRAIEEVVTICFEGVE